MKCFEVQVAWEILEYTYTLYPKMFEYLQFRDLTCLLSALFRPGKGPRLYFQRGCSVLFTHMPSL